MRNPYQRGKGPGRLGGNPLENVVGEAAGVQGQKVQPGKGATLQGKTATVKVGQSSSFNVSSGLVNALDVVQGVGQAMQGADKLGNQIDDARLNEMKKKIATMQSGDDWTNPESDTYLNDEQKLKAIQDIQNEYKGGWLNDKYRAQYEGEVANNRIATQNLGFNADLAWAQRSKDSQIAMGIDPGKAYENQDKLYDAILKKHGKDAAKAHQIQAAQQADSALWAQATTESTQRSVAAWAADGGLERLAGQMPTDVGFDEWMETAISAVAPYSQDDGDLLWSSYDPQEGKFVGSHSDMFRQNLRTQLEGVYNQQVAYEVAEDDLRTKTAIGNAPNLASVNFSNAVDAGSGALAVSDDWSAMTSMILGGHRPMTNGQRRPLFGDFLGKVSAGIFQMDATMTTEQMAEMMNTVAAEEASHIADFVGMEYGTPEFDKYLEDQVKLGMSTFKAARAGRQTADDKLGSFILEGRNPSMDSAEVKDRIAKDPFTLAIKNKEPARLPLVNAGTGKKYTAEDQNALAFGQMGQNFLITATWDRGIDARTDVVKKFTAAYEEYINNPDAKPDLLFGILKGAAEGTPWEVSLDSGGISFGMNAEASQDASELTKAKIGATLPYLQLNEDGYYTPLGEDEVVGTMISNLIRADSMTTSNGVVNPDLMASIVEAKEVSSAIFPPGISNRITADAIMEGLTGYNGSTDAKQELRHKLMRALEKGDFNGENGVGAIVEATLTNNNSLPLSIDSTTGQWKEVPIGVQNLFGAASGHDDNTPQEEVANSWYSMAGDLFGGYSGLDDSDAANRGGTMRQRMSVQRGLNVAEAAGLIKHEEGRGWVMTDPNGERTPLNQQALNFNQALTDAGWMYDFTYDEDGVVNGTEIVLAPSVYYGEGFKDDKPAYSYAGDFDHAMNEGMHLEAYETDYSTSEMVTDMIPGGVLAKQVGGAVSNWWEDTERPGGRGRFYTAQVDSIWATGRSVEEAHRILRNPEFRRGLADNTRPARSFWRGKVTTAEREAFANQIDETVTSLVKAEVDIGYREDAQDVRDLAERIRTGNFNMDSDPELWERTREIAKAQGYNMWETNPPLFSMKVAIMEKIMVQGGEHAALRHLTPYDLVPERNLRVSEDPSDLKDTERGWDRGLTYKLDNLHFLGARDVNNIQLPLFGPSMVRDKTKGDPKTFASDRARQRKVKETAERTKALNAPRPNVTSSFDRPQSTTDEQRRRINRPRG